MNDDETIITKNPQQQTTTKKQTFVWMDIITKEKYNIKLRLIRLNLNMNTNRFQTNHESWPRFFIL